MLVFIVNMISGVCITFIILFGITEKIALLLTALLFVFTGLIIQLSFFQIRKKIHVSEMLANDRIVAIKRKIINLNRRSSTIIHDLNQ